jgi:hypothetical protein
MNLAICAVILRDFVKPFQSSLELDFESGEDRFYAVMNAASDSGDEEILNILEYIEKQDLIETFFK